MKAIKRSIESVLAAGLLVLGLGFVEKAMAIVSTDTIVVSVTPGNVTYGVSIASPMPGGYNFGTVNMAATSMSTAAIVVTNTGTISEYFSLSVANTNGGWTPVAGVPATDQFRLRAFLDTSGSSAATSFADALSHVPPNPAGALYNQGVIGKTKPTPQAGFQRDLWLELTMPNDLSVVVGAQTMVLSITGQPL